LSEAEFRTAITVGEAEGVVEEEAAEMLHNVFEFGNRPVREIMIPRTDVMSVASGTTLAAFLEKYVEAPVSRFPVHDGTLDEVKGILSAKDVLMAIAKGTLKKDDTIDSLLRPPYFTPESKPISQLFVEMKDRNCRMATVVDEYGGTSGMVSMTQIIEEIVGPVGNEFTLDDEEYEVIDEHTFRIDGSMPVDEINEEMHLNLPEGEYQTAAGFILHLLNRIPKPGENLKYRSLRIVVSKMRGPKIEEIMITREKNIQDDHTRNDS
jgi:putative hemolysin